MDAECPLPFTAARQQPLYWDELDQSTSLNIVLTSTPKSFKSSTIKTLHEFLLLPYVVSRPSWYDSPGNSYNQRSKHANVTLTYLHAIRHNSDMLRSISIIFRELQQ